MTRVLVKKQSPVHSCSQELGPQTVADQEAAASQFQLAILIGQQVFVDKHIELRADEILDAEAGLQAEVLFRYAFEPPQPEYQLFSG